MEYRFTSKVIIILSVLILICGCGYLDNDVIEYQKNVVGNIWIQKQYYNPEYFLSFCESEESSVELVGNCRSVYYDSIKHVIYAEDVLFESNCIYHEIQIVNFSTDYLTAIKKKKITKDVFVEKIKTSYLVGSFRRP